MIGECADDYVTESNVEMKDWSQKVDTLIESDGENKGTRAKL